MASETPINVTPKEINIAVGEWYHGAGVEGVSETESAIVWSSSNPEVAAVNQTSGYIYGKSEGVATISAYDKKGGGSSGGNCDGGGTIIVGQTVKVSCIQLSTEYLTLEKGEQATVSATVYPHNATNKSLSWYSNNTSVATVNGGTICAIGNGTATITATATDGSGKSAYCCVTVTEDILVTSIIVHPASITLTVGDSTYLSASVLPKNATNKSLMWYSSDTCVATVNPTSGFLMSQNPGTTRIYGVATDGSGVQDYCTVTVGENIKVESITLDTTCLSLDEGEGYRLTATVCPANAVNKYLLWHSSDECAADVNDGQVCAVGNGSAIITAMATDGSGKSAQCYVTVGPVIPVSSIQLSPKEKTICVGEKTNLDVTICPCDATNKNVVWTTSDPDIATVNYYTGEITGKSVGTVTITATTVDGEYSDTCEIKVVLDNVLIKKDGNFNKVIFEHSGKVWYCINHDMIYDETNFNNSTLLKRSNRNLFVYYDENDPANSNTTHRQYTDDEIKLLYAIDPYGVADYINRHSENLFCSGGLESVLWYKDYIFRILFNRDPVYFARILDGTWYQTEDKSDINAVVSESETIFGMHPIYDLHTIYEFVGVCSSAINILFSTSFFSSTIPGIVISNIVKVGFFLVLREEAFLRYELLNYHAGNFFDLMIKNTLLDWALSFVSLYDSVNDLADAMNLKLNYNKEIINYCVHQTGYNVLFELRNGSIHNMNNVCEMLS